MERLARRIVSLRRRAGISQAELAEKAGTSQPTISRLERAKDPSPDARLLSRIADSLDVAVTDLVPQDLLEKLVPVDHSSTFYAFCPNPFCEANRIGLAKNGKPTLWWSSGSHYDIDRFGEINFCSKCGTQLVKECPSCKKKLRESGSRYCQTCGTKVTDRPTEDDWNRIHIIAKGTTSTSTDFEPIDEDDIPF